MAIKSILCVVTGTGAEANAINSILAIAKSCAASVKFLHISPDPGAYIGLSGEGIVANAPLLEAIRKENEARREQARQLVATCASKQHVPLDEAFPPARHASATFIAEYGDPDSIIMRLGCVSDLIVFGHGRKDPETLDDPAVIAALFNTGRPLLLLPLDQPPLNGESFRNIALAWKGTLEASRAMYHAMPFLERAENVHVLTVEDHGETYDIDVETDLLHYLRAHGPKAQCIVIASGQRTIGEALLMRAHELHCDLLILGAYGHNRFREMLLGGVTNYILGKATMPLLLSH